MSESGTVADPKSATSDKTEPSVNGKGTGNGESATPQTDAWFANSEFTKYGRDPQEAMLTILDRLKNTETYSGRLAEDLGETRKQVVDIEAVKKAKREFGRQLKDALNSDDEESLEGVFDTIAKLQFDFYESQDGVETARLKAYDSVITRNPELKDIRYGDVVREARMRGVSLASLADAREMKRFIGDVKAVRNSRIDVKAEIEKARREGIEEGKRLSGVKSQIPPSGGGGNTQNTTTDTVVDDPISRLALMRQQGRAPVIR